MPIPFANKIKKNLLSELLNKKVFLGGTLLIVFSMVANVLNFFYNAYLGRVLDLSDFALISLMGGLLSFAQTIFSAFTTTVNYKTGFLIGRYGESSAYTFLKNIRKKSLLISIIIALLWIVLTPLLIHVFPTGTPMLFLFFSLVLVVGLAEAANRGFLSSQLLFGYVAIINLIDPIIRLVTAFVLVHFHQDELTYIAMPLAAVGSFLLGYFYISRQKLKSIKQISIPDVLHFPIKFYIASLITGLTTIVFLSLDVLFANHYLSAQEAGGYGLLTLVGKMIYFLGSLVTPFTIPLLSRSEGAKKNSHINLYILIAGNILFAGVGFILFGLLGNWTLPLLYGKKVLTIIPYVLFFGFGIFCFTISKVFVNYYLVKKIYIFTWVTMVLAFVQVLLISFYHSGIQALAWDMSIIWILHLVCMILFHIFSDKIIHFENHVFDFFTFAFLPNSRNTVLAGTQNFYEDKILPVTIAIPVYNEESNIRLLLQEIIKQKEIGFFIKEIIVLSDGSTDATVNEARKVRDGRIRIVADESRLGKALRLNQLFNLANGAYVILLDADIHLTMETILSELVKPFHSVSNIGLVSGKAVPFAGKTFIEKSVNVSVKAYHEMVDLIDHGNNLFAVEGRIMAVKKEVGQTIPLPKNGIATDAFLYFSALKQNYSFRYANQAVVNFYSPTNMKEHVQQNKRFVARKYTLKRYFGKIVEKQSGLSRSVYIPIMFKYICLDPIHSIAIFFINVYSKYLANKEKSSIGSLWVIAESTKQKTAFKKQKQ